MSKRSYEPDAAGGRINAGNPADAAENLASVLVVGRSQITCVVVSRIVERAGLRPVAESPENAERTLTAMKPGTVILDGGADNRDCDRLFAMLSAQRQVSKRGLPRVVLLSTRTKPPVEAAHESVVDAVVAKPITPETLQPVVDRLIRTARA